MSEKHTPKPQQGTWILTAPDGTRWEGESPLHCAAAESRDRIPPEVALERILNAASEVDDPCFDALQELLQKCDDSDGSCYGTLSTSYVRDVCNAAIAKATESA